VADGPSDDDVSDGPTGSRGVGVVVRRGLAEEASESYLAYAMSTLVGRALPDVRDGLKPVHRRLLYAMHGLGLSANKPHRKCARVVGEVLGRLHPHGDQAVYGALVRLAQPHAMRLPLVDGHGNFGSQDDDPAAAMRYTECRLTKAAQDGLLAGLGEGVVDEASTFDAAGVEPTVLPAAAPLLLVNGAQGVAVGLATSVPPHNLVEVVDALEVLLKDPKCSDEALIAKCPGPDFPTGGEMFGAGARDASLAAYGATAWKDGKGQVMLRAVIDVEPHPAGRGREQLVVTELPYQAVKSRIVVEAAKLAESREIEGIADLRDESDRTGLRVVFELRKGADAALVRNQLLVKTGLMRRISLNCVAVVEGVPRGAGLRECLEQWASFRADVVRRRARHRLERAEDRLEVCKGFLAVQGRTKEVAEVLEASKTDAAAEAGLAASFGLSSRQARAVLEAPLRRLTRGSADKLTVEASELEAEAADLGGLLADPDRVIAQVLEEARAFADKHGTPRRTKIVGSDEAAEVTVTVEDTVANKESLVVLTRKGYVKRVPASTFSAQKRGTRGTKGGGKLKGADAVWRVMRMMDHDRALFITGAGRVLAARGFQIPEASRAAQGSPLVDVLPALVPPTASEADAARFAVRATVPVPAKLLGGNDAASTSKPSNPGASLALVTEGGLVKRLRLADLGAVRANGVAGVALRDGDAVAYAGLMTAGGSWGTNDEGGSGKGAGKPEAGEDLILVSSHGYFVRFRAGGAEPADVAASTVGECEDDGKAAVTPSARGHRPGLRCQGRAARGVAGIRLTKGARVVGAAVVPARVRGQPDYISSDDERLEGEGGREADSDDDDEAADEAADEDAGPWLVVVTRLGLGRRTAVARLRVTSRNARGSLIWRRQALSDSDGDAIAAVAVVESGDDEVLVGTANGVINRIRAADITCNKSRQARGSKLLALDEGDSVTSVSVVPSEIADAE